ncbi:hypothetical protein [Rhodococcus sp. MS13]|uniref:hypothetical protein n=1 Tax=Rhodococcus sp. MS13 TaxID=2579940 RepID=UPI0015622CF5|nr:hypothetical protein [Rhodococcus sp. MS13]NRH34297.1 hypothetical protein [Rhodococcus sp. MS13]
MNDWHAALYPIRASWSASQIAAALTAALDAATGQLTTDRAAVHAFATIAARPARNATIAAARRSAHDAVGPVHDGPRLVGLLRDVGLSRPTIAPADLTTIPADERRALAAILFRAARIDRKLRRQPAAPPLGPAKLPATLDAARRVVESSGRAADAYRAAVAAWATDVERSASNLVRDVEPLRTLYAIHAERFEHAARRAGRPTDPPTPIARAWTDYQTIGKGGRDVVTACQRLRAAL